MYEQERIKPYHEDGDKRAQVEEMFDNIAPTYDKLNHRFRHSIGHDAPSQGSGWC